MYTSADNKTENKSQSAALGPQEQKSGSGLQLEDNRPASLVQKKQVDALANKQNNAVPVQKKANNTGLPDTLKSGIESLSGHSMDDVKVHYNSSQPAQLNAHAYAQGTDIHVTSGQEKHLPHEAWHVVQQKQGRVKPTTQLKGKVNINDDEGLEKEADVMGAKSAKQTIQQKNNNNVNSVQKTATPVAQLYGPAEDAEQQAAGEAFEGLLHQYELLNADIIARRAAEQTAEGRPALLQDNIHLIELRQTILGQQEAINKELLTPGYRGLLETLNGVEPSDNVVENPTRIGKEIEVPSLVLKTRPALPNGVVLARTEAEELNFPVIKIETEGADRSKETSIEVIFGPLTTEEHDGDNFKFAKHALLVALASPTRATIGARIASYNAKLGAGRARFRLNVPEEVAGYISVSSKAQAKQIHKQILPCLLPQWAAKRAE